MPSSKPDLANRDIRQRDLVPPERLARCHAIVIGVGSIGRAVALQLAATGVPAMTLFDPDSVAVENLAVQGFWETDDTTAVYFYGLSADMMESAISELLSVHPLARGSRLDRIA